MNALITKVNSPSVSTSSGRDRMIRIGRITAFTTPKISATIRSATQSWRLGWGPAAAR